MSTIKANTSDNYESIMVFLSREKTPIAFQNKVDELMELHAFNSVEEAERWLNDTPIELEIYYEKRQGLFGVESGAVDNCVKLCSPYTQAEFEYEYE